MNGSSIKDEESYTITSINIAAKMGQFGRLGFVKEKLRVRNAWVEYIKNDGVLVEPNKYISIQ